MRDNAEIKYRKPCQLALPTRRFNNRVVATCALLCLCGNLISATHAQEPDWISIPALRQVSPNIGHVLADIDSRLPAKSNSYTLSSATYRCDDYATWVHEATHGVNARIRNQYGDGTGTDNAFYVLYGAGVVVKEPCPITLSDIASATPPVLRGPLYKTYLIEASQWWEQQPLNVVDEWTAYANGAYASLEYAKLGRSTDSDSDVAYSVEMGIYSLVLARVVASRLHKDMLNYDDTQLRRYIGWNWYRTWHLLQSSRKYPSVRGGNPDTIYASLQLQNPQVANLRDWLRVYFGREWCRALLHI